MKRSDRRSSAKFLPESLRRRLNCDPRRIEKKTDATLREIAFVLALTQKIREEIDAALTIDASTEVADEQPCGV